MNIQNCHSCKSCHVRCHLNWVQDFCLMLYLNPRLLLVKSWKNANSYSSNPRRLSTTRACHDEHEDTLFLWFVPILFLQHQRNFMDHSWLPAMGHRYKIKCRVYTCINKQTTCHKTLSLTRERYPNTAVAVTDHKNFDHNENNLIYSKAIRLTGK